MHQKRWHRATGFALHVEVLEDRQVLSATTVLQAPILLGPVHLGPAELSVTDDVLRPLVRLTESLPANGLGIVRSLLGNSLNIPGVPIHLNAGLQVLPISRLGTNALVNVADVPLDLSTNPSTNAKPEVGLGLFLNLGAEDGLDLPVDTNPPGGTSIDTHAGGEGVASPGAGILPGQNSATNLPPPLAFTPPLADGLPDLAFFANPPAGDLGLAGSVGALPVDTPVTLNLAGSSATDPDMLENDSTPASPLTSGLLSRLFPLTASPWRSHCSSSCTSWPNCASR